jgi:flagellar biosynthesis protein FlhA
VVILCIGMVPGIPLTPFLLLSSATFGIGYLTKRARKNEEEAAAQKLPDVPKPDKDKPDLIQPLEILEIEIGYGLIPIVDAEQSGELLDKIRAIRKQMALELGIVVPPMKLRDNLQLKPGQYVVLLKGIEMGGGEMMANHVLAMGPEEAKGLDGIPTKEPVFNLDAHWIKETNRDKCIAQGFTVVDHSTVIATHLTEIVRNNAHEFITRQETQKLVDTVSSTHPKVIEELAQGQVNMGVIQKVLQNLLREQVSIRDLVTILEAVADASPSARDPEIITEYVRQRMARSILKPYLSDGVLNIMILEKALEEKLISSLQTSDHGTFLALDLTTSQRLIEKIGDESKKAMIQNTQPVILVHPILRSKLKKFVERYIKGVAVISHNEIPSQIKIQSSGVIRINEN